MWSFMSFCNFEFFFALLYYFAWFAVLCHLLALRLFLFLDDSFEIFFGFWSSSCASWVLDSNFKLCAFCYQ
jgi:hypothetical protein